MRHITLAAATLAALAFAGVAYADSNYGPRKNGDQCWHGQGSNSIGAISMLKCNTLRGSIGL